MKNPKKNITQILMNILLNSGQTDSPKTKNENSTEKSLIKDELTDLQSDYVMFFILY